MTTTFEKDFDQSVADVAADQAKYATARAAVSHRLAQKFFRTLNEYLPVTDKSLEQAIEGSSMEAEVFLQAIERAAGRSLGKSLAATPHILDVGFENYIEQKHVPKLKRLRDQLIAKQGGDNFVSAQVAMVADHRLRDFEAKAQEAKRVEVMAELERDLQSIGSRQYPARKKK